MNTLFLKNIYSSLLLDIEDSYRVGTRHNLTSRSLRSTLIEMSGDSEGLKLLAKTAKCFDSFIGDDGNLVSDLRGGQFGPYSLLGRILQNGGHTNGTTSDFAGFGDSAGGLHPRKVSAVRQILRYLTKIQISDPSLANNEAAKAKFVETDQRVKSDDWDCELVKRAREHVARFLHGVDPYNVLPKHGPGSVASRENGHQKWHFKRVSLLNSVYPYHEYFVASHSHLSDWGGDNYVHNVAERPFMYNRFCEVPKDVTKNRGICLELPEVQFIQQGILRLLDDRFRHKAKTMNPRTHGTVLMHDQSVNQKMALRGSIDGSITTIDLSDASDLISLDLVLALFPFSWHEALIATRSAVTKFPDGSYYQLRKFASMGSALCFPVECLVFWSISLAAMQMAGFRSSDECPLAVYGDDIAVLSEYFGDVYDALKYCGLEVNWTKTCYLGGLRESCGADYYRGEWVTPLYLRKVATPKSKMDLDVFGSVVAHIADLRARGYSRTADEHEKHVRSSPIHSDILALYERRGASWNGDLPGGAFIGKTQLAVFAGSDRTGNFPIRWSDKLQRFEYLVPDIRPIKLRTRVAGFDRLFQSLTLQSGDNPDFDTPRGAVELCLRWVSPST